MKTSELLRSEGIPLRRLRYYLEYRRLRQPAKDASGDFVWAAEDVAQLRELEANRKKRLARQEPVHTA
jgi:hypothetical protein